MMVNNCNSYGLLEEGIDFYYKNEIYTFPYPYNENIKIYENKNVGHDIKLLIINNGISIKIKIYDDINKIRNDSIEKYEYKIRIKKIGFSLISDNAFIECKNNYSKYDRKELLFFHLKN